MFHYRAGQLEELLPALPDPQVLSLAIENDAAYVGTPLGVVEFRDGQRRRTLADGFFARALASRGETLHVGTEDEGIVDVPLRSRSAPRVATGVATRVTAQAAAPPVPILRLANLEGEAYAVAENAIYRYDPLPGSGAPFLATAVR